MKIVEYTVVIDSFIGDFTKRVNEHIRRGWSIPQHEINFNMTDTNRRFAQVLVKYDDNGIT